MKDARHESALLCASMRLECVVREPAVSRGPGRQQLATAPRHRLGGRGHWRAARRMSPLCGVRCATSMCATWRGARSHIVTVYSRCSRRPHVRGFACPLTLAWLSCVLMLSSALCAHAARAHGTARVSRTLPHHPVRPLLLSLLRVACGVGLGGPVLVLPVSRAVQLYGLCWLPGAGWRGCVTLPGLFLPRDVWRCAVYRICNMSSSVYIDKYSGRF